MLKSIPLSPELFDCFGNCIILLSINGPIKPFTYRGTISQSPATAAYFIKLSFVLSFVQFVQTAWP